MEVDRDEFERLVGDAMDAVPAPFREALEEVAVVVEDHGPPDMPPLYGLYHGVPRTAGHTPSGSTPPWIAIYMHPLMDVCRTPDELVEQVRVTVLHELGHHLGMDEDDLDELGYA